MAINVPLNAQLQNATQLQQQVQNAVNAVRINLGGPNGARALSSLSQPLGRLTGQADEFTKSLDAANARVLAFGASVGVVNAVSNAFKALVNSTIEVEKAITEISVVGDQFNGKTKELSQGLFNIAKNTGQAFGEVSKAALEFSRQGLSLEDTLQRTKDALILTRTTGLDTAKSVDGLTAAVNAFSKAGLSTTQVLNKLAAVDQAFAVSSADLIEAFQRTGAVAQQAGVSFDELAGIVTALQTETSRGGAVIGNALKTIFSRLQDTSTLTQLQDLGVAVQDLQGNILPARQILQNLAGDIQGLSKITQAGVFKDVAGTFQLNQLVSLVNDLNKAQSISAAATRKSAGATNEAFVANEKLNQSLDAILNKVATTGKQLGSLLGEIGLSDNLKGLLDGINSFLESVNSVLQGDDIGSKFAKGFVKGIGSVLSGPGLGVFLAIVVKLSYDLLKFGAQSLKTFFGIGKAANDQKQIQESIVQTLLKNQNVLNSILSAQSGQNAQGLKFLGILNQQAAAMQSIQSLAGNIAGTVYSAGYRQTPQGLARRSAGGYLPAQEAADVRRGVGGASPSSKVVSIPNFAFGGGKRGTMIANTSEYIVPNYAGGGSAIFNQDMVKTMGLPAGAKKITAAGGFVPNFKGIRGLQGKSLPFNYQNYVEDSFLSNLKTDKAPVILAGRIFEALARGDKFIDLYENKQSADIDKGAYKIAEAKLSVQAGLRDTSLGMGKSKGNRLLVPLSSKVDESQTKKLKEKGISLIKHNSLTHPLLFAKAREVISQYSNKTNIPNKIKIASSGYIPNFADFKNSDLAVLGLYGNNGNIDGSPVYTLQNQRPEVSKDIVAGYKNRITGFVNSYARQMAKKVGIEVSPKEISKSLSQASNVAGFIFEDVLNQLAGPNFDSNRISGGARADFPLTSNLRKVFGVSGTQKYAEIKLSPSNTDAVASIRAKQAALAGGALAPIETSPAQISALREEAIALGIGQPGRVDTKTQARRMAFIQKMINSGMIKSGYGASADQTKAIKRTLGMASSGYIPNFADLDGDGVVTQRDGFYQRLKSAAKKYSKNPSVDFILNQVLQSMLGLPENVDVMETVKACDKALKALKPEDELNKILREKSAAKKAQKRQSFLKGYYNSSSGYVPNFAASALQQAIAREKSAGLSDSQIYVDQSPSLKSPLNPMGLMVANTRDEPFGGIQGISRARKEGMNPKTYGAANGFVPNYAVPSGLSGDAASLNQPTSAGNAEVVNKGFGDTAGKIIILQSALTFLTSAVGEGETSMEKFTQQLAQSAGNITSAVFLFQQIAGTETKTKFGGFIKNLGLVGAVAAGAYEGFKLLDFAIKEFSGQNERTANALAKLETAAQGAIISLEDLTPEGQRTAQETGREVLKAFEGPSLPFLKGASQNPEIQKQAGVLSAQGLDPQILKNLIEKQSIAEAVKREQGNPNLKPEEIDIMVQEAIDNGLDVTGRVTEADLGKVLSDAFNFSEVKEASFNLATIREGLKSGRFGESPSIKNIDKNLLKNLDPKIIDSLIQKFKIIGQTQKAIVEEDKRLALGQRVSIELAKQKLDNLIQQKKEQIDLNASVGIDGVRFELETLDVSESYRNELEKRIKLKEIDAELSKKNLDIVSAAIDKLTSLPSDAKLGVSAEQFAGIAEALKGENIQSAKDLQEAVDKIGAKLGLVPDQLKGVNELFKDQFDNASKIADAQKQSAENTAAFNSKVIDTKNSLQAARLLTEQIANDLERAAGVRLSFADVGFNTRENAIKLLREQASTTTDTSESRRLNAQALAEERSLNIDRKKTAQDQFESQKKILEGRRNQAIQEQITGRGQLLQGKIDEKKYLELEAAAKNASVEVIKLTNSQAIANQTFDNTTKTLDLQAQAIYRVVGASTALKNSLDQFRLGAGERAASAQLEALGATDINSLAKAGIKTDVEANASGIKDNAEYYKTIQEQTRLREIQFDLATAESEVRRRELQYELKYTQELIDLKNKGATEQELIDARNRQILEQRSGGRGFERGLDTIQDRINNYRATLGEEIPNLFSQNLAQGLNDAISGAKDLKTALSDAATAFFQEITRKNISNLADIVTGGIGGFFTKKASGGLIRGGSGTKDDVPAMLMGGEYVVKKSAVNKYGKGFLDAINGGSIRGYATGGIVDPQTFPTQTGRGGFFTPGDYGQGAITGKNELLTFASQSFTGGQYDYMGGFGMGGATVSLEPESARLSALGREGSPMFERVQQSKDEAFKVYLEGLQKEKEYADLLDQIAKDKKARKKALQTAIVSAVVTSALNYAGTRGQIGAKNQIAATAGTSKLSGFSKFTAGLSGFGRGVFTSLGNKLTPQAESFYKPPVKSDGFYNPYPSNSGALPLPRALHGGNASMLLPNRNSGGLISGGSNIRDDVPAMLTGGEFVLNNRATQRIGLQNLNKLNTGATVSSEGSSPEMTQALISKLDELIQTTANSSKENVVVNVSTNEAGGQSAENPAGAEKELHKKIRQAVLDVIAQEKRLGGSLEKSR